MLLFMHRLRLPIRGAALLVAVPILSIAPELLQRSGCDRIPQWVLTHKAALPQTYDEFLQYPSSFRDQIFGTLPPASQVSIMVAHLRWFEKSRLLTDAQREFIDHELIDFVASGQLFDDSKSPDERRHAVNPIEVQMKRLFTTDLAKHAVSGFDEPEKAPRTLLALRIRLAEIVRESLAVSAAFDCQCASVSNWCGSGMSCQAGGCNKYGPPGCGTGLIFICDGVCCEGDWWGCTQNSDCCSGNCNVYEGYYCQPNASPILINVQSNTAQDHLTSATDGVMFDLTADGHKEQVAWTRPDSPVGFLALDRNRNGVIDDGSELFGNFTWRSDGTQGPNGFEALKDLDANHDGVIDGSDPVFQQLVLWFDRNHNGYSESSELLPLGQAGIETIGTAYFESPRKDRYGNWYRFAGRATLDRAGHGVDRRIFDVFLTTARAQ
jgi:hypothetical protein